MRLAIGPPWYCRVAHEDLELARLAIEAHAREVEQLVKRWALQMLLQLGEADGRGFGHFRASGTRESKM